MQQADGSLRLLLSSSCKPYLPHPCRTKYDTDWLRLQRSQGACLPLRGQDAAAVMASPVQHVWGTVPAPGNVWGSNGLWRSRCCTTGNVWGRCGVRCCPSVACTYVWCSRAHGQQSAISHLWSASCNVWSAGGARSLHLWRTSSERGRGRASGCHWSLRGHGHGRGSRCSRDRSPDGSSANAAAAPTHAAVFRHAA